MLSAYFFVGWLTIASIYDCKYMRIPNFWTIGFILAVITYFHTPTVIAYTTSGIILGYILYGTRLAPGGADIKLGAGSLGLMAGYNIFILHYALMFCISSLIWLPIYMLAHKIIRGTWPLQKAPFAPVIAIACMVTIGQYGLY